MSKAKIILSGNAGSGKSTVGKLLSEKLGVDFLSAGEISRLKAVELGMDMNTRATLVGLNGSGKSTLMKSIGLNIILAQIGYYTAASTFEYSPYENLFTRINSNDNMFRGLSSFMVEMIELTSILKRNNSNTLVLGDEICKGTENKSANIIVAYMLKTLSESKTSFITATHLHELINLPSVNELNNVKSESIKEMNEKMGFSTLFYRFLQENKALQPLF